MFRPIFAALLLAAATSGAARGQACVDYGSYTRVVADVILPALAGDVVVVGDHAYVASSEPEPAAGFMVLNVGDPARPELVATGGLAEQKTGLDVSSGFAYIVSASGLEILDVGDPASPAPRSLVPLGDPRAVKVLGQWAFVADYVDGFVVVDVTDPAAPSPAASLDLGGPAYDLAVGSGLAYLATQDSLIVVDVSTPASPVEIGSLFLNGGSLRTIELAGDTVYLGQFPPNTGVFSVDVTDPAAPVLLDDLPINYPFGILVDGATAYVAGDYGRLVIVDVSDPGAMTEIHSIDAAGRGMALAGSHLFMGSSNALPRFTSIALADHATPGNNGSYTLLPSVRYVRMGSGGAQVIGVQSNSFVVDTIDITGGGPYFPRLDHRLICGYDPNSALDLQPGLLAFAAEDAFYLVDIADPTDTRLAGSHTHGEVIRSVTLQGALLHVVDRFGLHVYDISDPAAATEIGFRQRGYLYGASLQGDFLYVAHQNQGLNVIDVSDPADPVIRGTLGTESFEGVTVDGDFAYLTGSFVTAVADISDPDAPFLVWKEGSYGDARNIQKFGDLVASPSGCGTLEILDVSDPYHPVRLAAPVVPNCGSIDVAMAAGLILMAAGDDKLLAYPGHCPAVSAAPPVAPPGFGRLTVAPNPFNPTTQIGVEIPTATRVVLTVYGLDGKAVKELYAGEWAAGTHSVTWDGRDANGRPVASGSYVVLLLSPLGRQSTRMVLLK